MSTKGYRRFARNITRQLNTMMDKDKQAIIDIIDINSEKTKEFIDKNIPIKTGELKRSIYLEHYETDNGYGINVGIATTKHSPDNFTNTKLAGWLLNKPNVDRGYGKINSNSQQQMKDIVRELEGLKWNIRWDIEDYWQSKHK